jgi:putative transposase
LTQVQFILNIDDLKDCIMNSYLDTVVKASMVLILNSVMEDEREKYLQAGAYERSNERRDYRNGYYERRFHYEYWKNKIKGTLYT